MIYQNTARKQILIEIWSIKITNMAAIGFLTSQKALYTIWTHSVNVLLKYSASMLASS